MPPRSERLCRFVLKLIVCAAPAACACVPVGSDAATAVEASTAPAGPGTDAQSPGDDDYATALARVRSGDCAGVFWRTGRCGDLLFVLTGGYVGVVRYYDAETGRLVDRESFTDLGPQGPSRLDDCASTAPDESGLCGMDAP